LLALCESISCQGGNKLEGEKMMFYAHKGNATDNAFTTYNGSPTRTLLAFETKKEREEAREKIWQDSGHAQNLIDCGRKLVEQYMGRDFVVLSSGECVRRADWEMGQYDEN
jgi:hypothetical protein